MRVKKLILTATTVVAIISPLVPKSVNVNITLQERSRPEKPYTTVRTMCVLQENVLDKDRRVCKYKCKDGDGIIITKTYYNSSAICPSVTEETVRKTQR